MLLDLFERTLSNYILSTLGKQKQIIGKVFTWDHYTKHCGWDGMRLPGSLGGHGLLNKSQPVMKVFRYFVTRTYDRIKSISNLEMMGKISLGQLFFFIPNRHRV